MAIQFRKMTFSTFSSGVIDETLLVYQTIESFINYPAPDSQVRICLSIVNKDHYSISYSIEASEYGEEPTRQVQTILLAKIMKAINHFEEIDTLVVEEEFISPLEILEILNTNSMFNRNFKQKVKPVSTSIPKKKGVIPILDSFQRLKFVMTPKKIFFNQTHSVMATSATVDDKETQLLYKHSIRSNCYLFGNAEYVPDLKSIYIVDICGFISFSTVFDMISSSSASMQRQQQAQSLRKICKMDIISSHELLGDLKKKSFPLLGLSGDHGYNAVVKIFDGTPDGDENNFAQLKLNGWLNPRTLHHCVEKKTMCLLLLKDSKQLLTSDFQPLKNYNYNNNRNCGVISTTNVPFPELQSYFVDDFYTYLIVECEVTVAVNERNGKRDVTVTFLKLCQDIGNVISKDGWQRILNGICQN